MAESRTSRFSKVALLVLVPLAYLSMALWRPANAYGPGGREGTSPFIAVLMTLVFAASCAGWRRHSVIASLGLLACLLWLAVVLLPVL